MQASLTIIVGLVVVLHQANSQCFYENEDPSKPTSTDLSGIADFGLSLFREVFPYKEEKNFFFSPYSIWNAFALAYFGSGGQTELELRKVLGLSNKTEALMKMRSLRFLYTMRQKKAKYTFNLANRAYFDSAVKLNTCLDKILNDELRVVDMKNSVAVAEEINEWVSNTTKGRINQLVTGQDLANANMVLTNAAFFKGTWLYQFKKSKTKKAVFYSSPSEFSFVNMMVQKGSFRHGISEELGANVLELPYNGESVSMYILLPPFIRGHQGFEEMVQNLNSTTLKSALNGMWRTEVEVQLPKFKLEESIGDELILALNKMGLKDIFDPSAANLTEFSRDAPLSVGKTIHKAFVEVSEEGTEAAAATALISFRIARPLEKSKFICNHPFLFLIYDNETENVLFMGAYKSPKQF